MTRRRASGAPALALAIVLAGVACLVGSTPATAQGGLVADGEAPDFFMLFTGDVIGYIDPCG